MYTERGTLETSGCFIFMQDSHRIRKLDNRPLEMSTVDGDIKLEYRDDFGRVLVLRCARSSCPCLQTSGVATVQQRLLQVQTPKEAFRSISWKFHGKAMGVAQLVLF